MSKMLHKEKKIASKTLAKEKLQHRSCDICQCSFFCRKYMYRTDTGRSNFIKREHLKYKNWELYNYRIN